MEDLKEIINKQQAYEYIKASHYRSEERRVGKEC